jgi:PKD repeat protein
MKNFLTISMSLVLLLMIKVGAFSQPQTITLRPGPTDGKGAELTDYSPYTNFGNSPWFDANAWTASGDSLHIRSLMQFDLTSIPPNSTIISAKLSLFCNPASTHYQLQAGDNQCYLLRVTEPWDDETVTWNNQPAVSMDNPVLLPTSTMTVQNYPDNDVTTHVQDMVNDPEHNYGWQIRLVTEYLYRSMQLSSCHDAFQYRPSLEITYELCDPPVANWSYYIEEEQVHFTDASTPDVETWLWDFGDGLLTYSQNPVHLYAAPGKYYVCLEVTDSCGSDMKCDSVVVETNSIAETSGRNMLVYPVPATSTLYVSMGNQVSGGVELSIMDVTGALFLKKEVIFNNPGNIFDVDLTNFAAGSYIVRAVWSDKVIVKKFIVLR